MKPAALTDSEIRELEDRIIRGWVVRRDQWERLIAMARERNLMVAEMGKSSETQQAAMVAAYGLGGP